MRIWLLAILVALGCRAFAQKSLFIRVYDSKGKRFTRGQVFSVTDSSLLLVGKDSPSTIPLSKIGFIKTKRSAGHNILVGAISVGIPLAILGAISAPSNNLQAGEIQIFSYTPAQGAEGGLFFGGIIGAFIGTLTIPLKGSTTFKINGDPGHWKAFQSFVAKTHASD